MLLVKFMTPLFELDDWYRRTGLWGALIAMPTGLLVWVWVFYLPVWPLRIVWGGVGSANKQLDSRRNF